MKGKKMVLILIGVSIISIIATWLVLQYLIVELNLERS